MKFDNRARQQNGTALDALDEMERLLRRTITIRVAVGVVFLVTISGCSYSNDRGRRGPSSEKPYVDYMPGLVYAYFDRDASPAEVESLVQSFGLSYTYVAKGEVWVHAHIVRGDVVEVRERLSASPLVDRVDEHGVNTRGASYLRIRFVVKATLDDALAFVATYPEIEVAGSRRALFYVEFRVPEGDEDMWVNRFLEEALVISSHKVWLARQS